MQEGWYDEQHFILFDDEEAELATLRYGVSAALPGYKVVGLCGWDDFILRSSAGQLFTVPTVPLLDRYLEPFDQMPPHLQVDTLRSGLIKWYVKPVAFGGEPEMGQNVIWVDHQQHVELVLWWNKQYQRMVSGGA
jgi:hypothetical protein